MVETTAEDKIYKKTEDLKTKFVKGFLFDPILKKIKEKQKNDAKKQFISSVPGRSELRHVGRESSL